MERPGEYAEDPPPPGLEAMWTMDGLEGPDCDCPGPPPEFLLPPPPRPPFAQSMDDCSEDPLPMETCDAVPQIDASYRSSPSLQTSAVIVLCSVLGLFVFIAIILMWKHKRKVQNFLPCKNSSQNNRDGSTAANVYEDLHEALPRHIQTPIHYHHHPHLHHSAGGHSVAPSIEMIDVKNNLHYPSGYPISPHPPVFLCSSPGPDPYSSQDLYNPVYEELSDADSEPAAPCLSEDEFAEDELSLGGDALPPYRPRAPPPPRRPLPPLPPPAGGGGKRGPDRQQFHEGMLLDALLRLYPRVGSVGPPPPGRPIPSIAQRIQCAGGSPYEAVPVLGRLATFRPAPQAGAAPPAAGGLPKPYSQDSAFGSDSGYSNHTSGTRGSSRGRSRDARRLSQLSADLALT